MAYRITDECISCGVCLDECSASAISEGEEKYVVETNECTDCGSCSEVCPVDAVVEG